MDTIKFGPLLAIAIVLSLLSVQTSEAGPLDAYFSTTFIDARTDDNQFLNKDNKSRWSIDSGADSYQNEFYERPTTQTFTSDSNGYGAAQYFANIDIDTARIGYDSTYLYVEINLVGDYFHKEDNTKDYEGLKYQYGFRFSTNPDGSAGYLMYGEFANPKSQPNWISTKTEGFKDVNGDVGGAGGLSVTGEKSGNGYELKIISDGSFNGKELLFIRMSDFNTVQFALDYVLLGLNSDYLASIQYFDIQAIKGGPKDPANYFWNDEYTYGEAGSPYSPSSPQNIYELDTVRSVPEPGSTLLLLGFALAPVALSCRWWHR